MSGHVFVVPGDLTRFACDAWLLPTDSALTVTERWKSSVPGLGSAIDGLGEWAEDLRTGARRAMPLPDWPADLPHPVLTTVPMTGVRDAADVDAPLREGLAAAAAIARGRGGPPGRGAPLVAMPLFGSGAGGGDALRGALVRAALDRARETGVDVALVLNDRAALAQAHAYRRDRDGWWPELDENLRRHAGRLAGLARDGRLVPFIGSGVSISAGLPTWAQLLERLAAGRLAPDVQREFGHLGALDQAEVLQGLFDDRRAFAAAVADATNAPRYGLAPALLSGLPCTEAVTLNYDELYERAGDDVGTRTAVLPGQAADAHGRWLLKLHGTVSDPDSIVLTRRDYLGYSNGRAALSALAKALLLTRHLLFVGFGFTDDHFHEVVHDVRAVRSAGTRSLGTALMLSRSPLRDQLWSSDLDIVALGHDDGESTDQARRLEIFLDCLLAHADRGVEHILDPRFEALLSDPEKILARRLTEFAAHTTADEQSTGAWTEVAALLERLGRRR